MWDYFYCALCNIGRKRFRSIITICGIVIGVSSVIVIGAIGNGAKYAVNAQLDSLGINGVNISQKSDSLSTISSKLTLDDLNSCLSVKGVNSAMPLIMQQGNAVLHGQQKQTLIWGIGNNAGNMISLKLDYGRFITQSQIDSHAKVCLVDDTFAKSAYKRSNITGKNISIYMGKGYQTFKVIGIVESGSSLLYNLVGEYIPTFIYIPYTAAEDLRASSGFDEIMIKESKNYNADTTGALVTNLLAKKHVGNTYVASNMIKQKQRLSNILGIITIVISAVGAISLIVAGLGIMTVMLVSVNERTREIGIKKAIGAKKSVIMFEFLLEALLITIIGGTIGIATGIMISYFASKTMNFNFNVNFSSVIISSGFAIITGILFGVYPAYKAANLNPVDALRQE